MNSTQKSQAGFTLIELVVVIVILGILAATALPKFIDLSNDARAGVMKGVESSMRSVNSMLYAKAAAQGKAELASTTITVNGSTAAVAYGYATDAAVLLPLLNVSGANLTAATVVLTNSDAKTPASCIITYAPATSATTLPTYTPTTTGC